MKILIPDGMLARARRALGHGSGLIDDIQLLIIATAFCEHIAENPIVPTKEQLGPVVKECGKLSQSLYGYGGWIWMITEWQRRMLLAPGPDVPEAVSKLEPGKCPHRWQAKIDYITMERVVYCELCCWEYSRTVGGEKEVR